MKLTFLGTAGAEGYPAPFCNCPNCTESRKRGGKNLRSRTQALVDDKILIDFPCDTYMHTRIADFTEIHTCILTHSHGDHLYPNEFSCRVKPFCECEDIPLVFYGTKPAYEIVMNKVKNSGLRDGTRVWAEEVEYQKPFDAEGYRITPLKANHDFNSVPAIYIIEKDDSALLYATDTGAIPEESMEYIKNSGAVFGLVVLDCTMFDSDDHFWGHMDLERCQSTREALLAMGAVKEDTPFYLTHLSHRFCPPYEEANAIAEKYGMKVPYEGEEVSVGS